MVNTTFTTTNSRALFVVPVRRLFLVYDDPKVRPPVLDEMLPDLERLMASMITEYTDESCQNLKFDELMAEGRSKLAQMLSKDWLSRCISRAKFFGAFKLAFKRHLCSLVLKFRYTQKRTGVKPPPRNAKFTGHERTKTVEISMDDPESGVQIPDRGMVDDDKEWHELVEEYSMFLTPVENWVFHQMVQPNARARLKAQLDAYIGHKPGAAICIKIRDEHLAYGLGMCLELFNEASQNVQEKIRTYRSMTGQDHDRHVRYNAAVATLSSIFGLQVPKDTEDIIVRRMFTVAARHQIKKVLNSDGTPHPQIAELLQMVGAKVPRLHGDTLGCYGVLYNRNDRRCSMCDLRRSCEAEAANVGLDKITLSPKLLGARQIRVPVILPEMVDELLQEHDVTTADRRDVEVLHYLDENFHRFVFDGDFYYRHRDNISNAAKPKKLFCLGTQLKPLRLRFCNPSLKLRAILSHEGHAWIISEDMSAAKIIELIDQHSQV